MEVPGKSDAHRKKTVTKDHILSDSFGTKCPEQGKSRDGKLISGCWREGRDGEWQPKVMGFLFGVMKMS